MSTNRARFENYYNKDMFMTMADAFKRFGDEFGSFVYKGKSTSDREILYYMSGLGVAGEKPEGTNVLYDDPIDGPTKTIVHKTYGLAFRITEEAIEDDKYGQMKQMSQELATSAREAVNLNHFAPLNLGTDANYFSDANGQALFTTGHKKLDKSTYSNLYTATSLSQDAIQNDLLIFENLTDHRGKKINRKGACKTIVVNSAQEFALTKIFGSTQESENNTNAINALIKARPDLKFVCTPYVANPNARTYVGELSPVRGLISFMRRPVTFARDGDFNTGDALFKVTFRMSVGCADPMNLAQNPGA